MQTFIDDSAALADFREQLHGVRDMERTIGRLSVGSGNARDLVALTDVARRTAGGEADFADVALALADPAIGCGRIGSRPSLLATSNPKSPNCPSWST